MSGGRRGPDAFMVPKISSVTAIGSVIELDGLNAIYPHCFAGVQFFSDSAGLNEAIPTTGTLLFRIKTVNTNPRYEAPPVDTIQANAPSTISWAANTQGIKVTPTGIDVALYYRLVVICNES